MIELTQSELDAMIRADAATTSSAQSDEAMLAYMRRKAGGRSGWHQQLDLRTFAGVHQASSKRKSATRKRTRKNPPHATVAISYSLRHPSYYFWPHDIAYYVNAYKSRGVITREELDFILDTIKAAA